MSVCGVCECGVCVSVCVSEWSVSVCKCTGVIYSHT